MALIVYIIILAVVFVAIMLVARTNMKSDGDIAGWLWRKYPKYENLDKNTIGRIAGAKAISRKEGGFADIRYKVSVMKTEVDRDVPVEFIKPIEPPNTPITEGIVRVYPYTIGKPTFYKIWDTYKDLILLYENNYNLMASHLDNIKELLKTKIDRRAMLEELDSITKILGRLNDNIKVKKSEVVSFSLEGLEQKSDKDKKDKDSKS